MSPSNNSGIDEDMERIYRQLRILMPTQVARIDRMLQELGLSGELHLIVEKGNLRFINKAETIDLYPTGGKE